MRAVILNEQGSVDKLVLEPNFPDPVVGQGQVLIRVRACSLNYHDVFVCKGIPGVKEKFPLIIGMDFAGEVAKLGPGVAGWSIGDRVLVDPYDPTLGKYGQMVEGGCAELAVVRPQQLIRMPKNVTFEQAASLPVAYATAHRMMFTRGEVSSKDRVLILGASGGVGTCCVSLAKLAGAEVISCGSSPEKLKVLKDLGSDQVIDYKNEDFVKRIWELYGKPPRRGGDPNVGVSVVVNFTGGDTWVRSMQCLRQGGRMLTCGATAGYDPKTDIRFIWSYELDIRGSNGWMPDDLTNLMKLMEEEKFKPLITEVLPLEETARGLKLLDDRKVIGKVVITM
jgi:alcohol dehydrogenase